MACVFSCLCPLLPPALLRAQTAAVAPPSSSAPSARIAATTTPLAEPVPEETETLIACALAKAPSTFEAPIFESPRDAEATKGVYHYKLWLPKGYAASGPAKRFPCMFILSPDGDASMGSMAEHLKAKGYVVVLLVESRNGPWAPIVGNFLAAHDDVVRRVRVEEGRKFATGFSGGARAASLLAQARPGFGGVILQGAGGAQARGNYLVAGMQRNPRLQVAVAMGSADGNAGEVARLKAAFNNPARFQAFEFAGGHEWAPREAIERAMAWIEQKNGF